MISSGIHLTSRWLDPALLLASHVLMTFPMFFLKQPFRLDDVWARLRWVGAVRFVFRAA